MPERCGTTDRLPGEPRTFTVAEWAALKRPQKGKFLWRYDDGGRAQAGYRGSAGDCICRAIAIACERPYAEIYETLNALCRPHWKSPRSQTPSARFGMPREIYEPLLLDFGWRYHTLARRELFTDKHVPLHGRSIVPLPNQSFPVHICAVVHGVIRDTYDCSFKGTRWINGYYRREA